MLNEFIFGGLPSSHFGMIITGAGVYNTPARKVEKVSIDGRNGDLIIEGDEENAAFENVTVIYPAVIYKQYKQNRKNLSAALSSMIGYQRLEDTIEPDRFRLGAFRAISNPKMPTHLDAGTFQIAFDCKPQWYLKSGEQEIALNSSGAIFNPTHFYSKPLILVTGNGTIGINSQTITITNNASSTITIDSETENCYTGATFKNSNVSFSDNKYPRLRPWENNITLSGVTIKVTPRWFEI